MKKLTQTRFTIAALLLVMFANLAYLPLLMVGGNVSAAPGQQTAPGAVGMGGVYIGSITVEEPFPLGAVDLAFTLDPASGQIGLLDAAKSPVFQASPALEVSITSSPDAITPTFRIDSAVFGGVISGRNVQRSFVLTGEVADGGATLRGQYEETIRGFTQQPLVVRGVFLVTRPDAEIGVEPVESGSTAIDRNPVVLTPATPVTLPMPEAVPADVNQPVPASETPASPESVSAEQIHSLYLPIVTR